MPGEVCTVGGFQSLNELRARRVADEVRALPDVAEATLLLEKPAE